MYPITGNEQLIPLPLLPKPIGWSPYVVSSDIDTRFVYPVSEDFIVDEARIYRASSQLHSRLYAVLELKISIGYMNLVFGKGLTSHPLFDRGLRPCGVFKLLGSSWSMYLQDSGIVHTDKEIDHFIFAFDNETLECISTGFADVEYIFGTNDEAKSEIKDTKWYQ